MSTQDCTNATIADASHHNSRIFHAKTEARSALARRICGNGEIGKGPRVHEEHHLVDRWLAPGLQSLLSGTNMKIMWPIRWIHQLVRVKTKQGGVRTNVSHELLDHLPCALARTGVRTHHGDFRLPTVHSYIAKYSSKTFHLSLLNLNPRVFRSILISWNGYGLFVIRGIKCPLIATFDFRLFIRIHVFLFK